MINTFTGYGSNPLQYPHHTKWMDGKIHIVTTKDNLVKVGDEVECVHYGINQEGEEYVINCWHLPIVAKKIIEQRPAKGNHREGIKAIFQLIEY